MATVFGTGSDAVLSSYSIDALLEPSRIYEPLDKERKEIRIAELFPAEFRNKTERPHVSLFTRTTPLGDISEPFLALSYAWGDPRNTTTIFMNNRLVQVTENLSVALQHLEHGHQAVRIWADAVCINQNDEAEKSHQVQMMTEIYRKASEVVVWLGPSEQGSDEAIRILREVGNEVLRLDTCAQPSEDGYDGIRKRWFPLGVPNFDLRPVQELFQRSWFRRVWALQEAAASETVTIYCGNSSISKQALRAGARILVILLNEASTGTRDDLSKIPIWQTLGGTNFIARRTLNLVTSEQKKFPLQTLLMETTTNLGEWAYEATDPRDRIFAILGFSSDATALGIYSDYEKTCQQVFLQVAQEILATSGNIDILYVISGAKNVKTTPSWVPDWSVPIPSTFGPRHIGKFSAAGLGSHPSVRFQSDRFDNKLLVVSGYKFDTVDTIMQEQWDAGWRVDFGNNSPALRFAQRLQRFGQGQRTAYESEEERIEALWRTPIADCDAWFDVMQKARPPASETMRHSFCAFIGTTELSTELRNEASTPYVHVMKLESARRRIFMTSRGYYGLGQESLRAGDSVSILCGGDSPFIIRDAGLGYHELVGEAYVHGIMHGEHLESNPSVEDFIIC